MLIVDGHCDTIQVALNKGVYIEDKSLSFNLDSAKKYNPIIQMTAAYINPSYKDKSFQRACDIISHFEKQLEKYPETLIQVKSSKDIEIVEKQNKIGCLLTIENGSAIEDKLDNIEYFYSKGVRVMSITWNADNLLGCGALTDKDNGLTDFGKQYIYKLNEKHIIVDVSHSSEKTFWDTIKESNRPVAATHSCCYSLCKHPRNLKDDQIKAIAQQNGIIGVCYCTSFLSETGKAGTEDIAKHIAYIANLVGVDYIGLGSDFDGLEKEDIPYNLRTVGETNNLIQALKNIGFNSSEIEKIMGENWLRVLKQELN